MLAWAVVICTAWTGEDAVPKREYEIADRCIRTT